MAGQTVLGYEAVGEVDARLEIIANCEEPYREGGLLPSGWVGAGCAVVERLGAGRRSRAVLRGRTSRPVPGVIVGRERIRSMARRVTSNRRTRNSPAPVIFTVGHSTRSFEELVAILRAHGVERVVDVRTIPRSRHNPQFNREFFSKALRNRRIGYRHMKALGGLRRARPDSINTGWRNASFRGFADYMQTPPFEQALAKLLELAQEKPTVMMCAEAVPWRCHRSLIADALTVRGCEVRDLMDVKSAKPHVLNSMARVHGLQVTYPAVGRVKYDPQHV